MEAIANYIEHMIITNGALGVFIGSVMEEIIVPIPSSLVQAGAGFFLMSGMPVTAAAILKLIVMIALPAAIGVCLGSLAIYFLTYYGGMNAVRKFGKYFFLNPDKVEATRADIATHPRTLMVITALRFIPLLPNAFVTAAAGLLRIPFWTYLASTFIGVFIRALYLGAIGWLTGSVGTHEGQSFYGKLLVLGGVLLVISVVTGLVIRYVHKRKKNKAV